MSGCPLVATTMGGVQAIVDDLPKEMVHEIEPNIQQLQSALMRCLNQQIKEGSRQKMINAARKLWTWQALESLHLQMIE